MATGVIWIVGRPAAGKTALGRRLTEVLQERGRRATLLDSDDLRRVVTPRPRYTEAERELVYRALAYLAARLAREDIVTVVAATAHREAYRQWAREICPRFTLIYARCPLDVCRRRDPKGLYARAAADPDNTLPGIGVSFDEPADPDIIVDTHEPVSEGKIEHVVRALEQRLDREGG